jgi:hypothetical protein
MIGLMVCSLARIGAALGLRVEELSAAGWITFLLSGGQAGAGPPRCEQAEGVMIWRAWMTWLEVIPRLGDGVSTR